MRTETKLHRAVSMSRKRIHIPDKRKKRDNPEQRLQMAVAQYLALALRPPTIWTAFPAGGGGWRRGAYLKAMGLQKGWPDILVMHPFPTSLSVVGLELKSPTGRMSPEQASMSAAFHACRSWYVMCRSVEEVEKALRFCKVPLHATTMRAAA